jgi:N-acetylglucosaminyldiphosphoundecaprenol N-acetyl-beta-D-mannosaminyltransferase
MSSLEKKNLFGIDYSITNYTDSASLIVKYAIQRTSYGMSALAVHGLIESCKSDSLRKLVNKIDLVVPDGQPIRWALNSFYSVNLKDRVYGPELTLHVLRQANELGLRIFLYGSTAGTLRLFSEMITNNFPGIKICGVHIDRFREATAQEDEQDIMKINNSGANIVLVGRGCPRQEIWVANHIGKINAVMMAVGAAFDFHAGTVRQAPKWMQDRGLEWLFRLIQEPQRLWKRYLFTNTYFIYLFLKYKTFNLNHE